MCVLRLCHNLKAFHTHPLTQAPSNKVCVSKVKLYQAFVSTSYHRMSVPYFPMCLCVYTHSRASRILDAFGTTMSHLASGQGWCLSGLASAGRGDSWKRWSTGQTGHHLDTHTAHTQVIHGSKLVWRLTSNHTLPPYINWGPTIFLADLEKKIRCS